MAYFITNPKVQFVTGPRPIPTLACPCTTGLELPSNSYGYGSQSSPAPSGPGQLLDQFLVSPSRTCPAPALAILVQYAG